MVERNKRLYIRWVICQLTTYIMYSCKLDLSMLVLYLNTVRRLMVQHARDNYMCIFTQPESTD